MIQRTKERIRETGEIFTPPELTNEILDHLPAEMWEPDRTFLDPAAGDGNILVEILKRKLSHGHNPTQALKSIFGIDIMGDNVKECHRRLLEIAGNTEENRKIVEKNILQGDTLTFDWQKFESTPLIEY